MHLITSLGAAVFLMRTAFAVPQLGRRAPHHRGNHHHAIYSLTQELSATSTDLPSGLIAKVNGAPAATLPSGTATGLPVGSGTGSFSSWSTAAVYSTGVSSSVDTTSTEAYTIGSTCAPITSYVTVTESVTSTATSWDFSSLTISSGQGIFPTGLSSASGSVFLSGTGYPSGSGALSSGWGFTASSYTLVPTTTSELSSTSSDTGVFSTLTPSSGSGVFPSGTGVASGSSIIYPSGSGIFPSGSGYPTGSSFVYPTGNATISISSLSTISPISEPSSPVTFTASGYGTGSSGFPVLPSQTSVLYPNSTTFILSTATASPIPFSSTPETDTFSTLSPTSTQGYFPSSGVPVGSGSSYSYTPSGTIGTSYPTSSSSISGQVSATPITVASTTLFPTTSASMTTTVTGGQASGTPNPSAFHCGVHGEPLGPYFLSEFANTYEVTEFEGEDAIIILPVTLETCWKLCVDNDEDETAGCKAYHFFPEPSTGAPRCDLYGGSVADDLRTITPTGNGVWYDEGCGHPVSASTGQ